MYKKKSHHPSIRFWVSLAGILIISIGILSSCKQENNSNNEDKNSVIDGEVEMVQGPLVDFNDFMPQEATHEVFREITPVRGIYVTGNSAGITSRLDAFIQMADDTEINAFVIDVKNDKGHITFDMDLPIVDEIGAEDGAISDIKSVMDKLYDHNIFPIARIVVFKDPLLSSSKTDYAIKNSDGTLFYYKDVSWLNPYNHDTWKYVIDVAKEAIHVGFKEIQFDYIRFEATKSLEGANFGPIDPTKTKIDTITEFLDYAQTELKPYDVELSADVFGTIIISEVDANIIGQNYVEMAKRLDIICPMVYPSHYGRGYYGIPASKSPDLYPYEIIYGSMMDSNEKLAEIPEGENVPRVRPWLQAFNAPWLKAGNYMEYDHDAIRAQIQAAYDAGLSEWLLWNASNRYEAGLLPEED